MLSLRPKIKTVHEEKYTVNKLRTKIVRKLCVAHEYWCCAVTFQTICPTGTHSPTTSSTATYAKVKVKVQLAAPSSEIMNCYLVDVSIAHCRRLGLVWS